MKKESFKIVKINIRKIEKKISCKKKVIQVWYGSGTLDIRVLKTKGNVKKNERKKRKSIKRDSKALY